MRECCAVLFLLFLSARANSEERNCRKSSITESDSTFENNIIFHGLIDNRLLDGLKNLYGNVTTALDKCPGGVKEIINATKHTKKYMVYMGVDDFYKFNYNDVSKHLIYAGDLRQLAYRLRYIHCKKSSFEHETCAEKSKDYDNAILMTTNVERNPTLHKFIKDYIDITKKPKATTKIHNNIPNILLICYTETKIRDQLEMLNFNDWTQDIIIKHSVDCENDVKKFQFDLIAIMAPKPFETDYDILVPILLYKPTCYDENISIESNNLNLIKSCDTYKDALIHLMNKADWKRAAIVSDNTAYSEAIEREIIALFQENEIVYTVEHCVDSGRGGCRFNQALESLKNADAKVFIANVHEDNLKTLYKDVKNIMWGHSESSSWILRDFLNEYGYETIMGDVFTISLAPSISHIAQYTNLGVYSNNADQVSNTRIIEGILKIRIAYTEVKDEYDVAERRIFFRKLKEKINDFIYPDVTAYITKNSEGIIGKLLYKSFHIEENVKYRPDLYQCSLRSNNFLYPCDESNILKILVILVAVAASALLVTVIYNYFILPTTNRYRNLP